MCFCMWRVRLSSRFYCCRRLLCPGKYLGLLFRYSVCACFHLSCTCLSLDGKFPSCVSTNNGPQLTTRPPQSSAHSPLFKTVKARPSLVSSVPAYLSPVCSLSPVPLFCAAVGEKFVFSTLQDCACLWRYKCVCLGIYTQGVEHGTDVKIQKSQSWTRADPLCVLTVDLICVCADDLKLHSGSTA